ncbi:MAG: hypothetical protein EAX96_21285 [Candidatus Lokiarchaeota archaeon]|nr:hypothetical protein [Candidatus Lokiarchaeota archaeon]
MQKYKLRYLVTQDDCPWLEKDIEKGTIVYEYCGCTYGCVSQNGVPITIVPNEVPFIEIQKSALEEI